MDLDETSYIEVFHFPDEMVFSGLFNKQYLWFGLLYNLIHIQFIPFLLHSGEVFTVSAMHLLS